MLKSTEAQARSLAADYGPNRAAHMPATLLCHLFTADPDDGGVEISGGGYAPASLPSDAFPSLADMLASPGAELVTPDFSWTSSSAWSGVASYAELRDPAGVRYDGAPLAQRINVIESGTVVTISASIFYNELV